jgi:hypothetical protein
LKLDTLVMIQTKFGFNWSSSFRGEDFWKSLRRTTDAKWWQKLTWPLGRWAKNMNILECHIRNIPTKEKILHTWPPWYNWNIVESGAKYHKPKSFGNWANEKVLLYPAAMWKTWDKNDQHSKIYLPCNFEVNLVTHLGVIALFSSSFWNFNTFHLVFQNLEEIKV